MTPDPSPSFAKIFFNTRTFLKHRRVPLQKFLAQGDKKLRHKVVISLLPLLMYKLFRYPRFTETPKGSLEKFFGTVLDKNTTENHKSFTSPLMLELFRNPQLTTLKKTFENRRRIKSFVSNFLQRLVKLLVVGQKLPVLADRFFDLSSSLCKPKCWNKCFMALFFVLCQWIQNMLTALFRKIRKKIVLYYTRLPIKICFRHLLLFIECGKKLSGRAFLLEAFSAVRKENDCERKGDQLQKCLVSWWVLSIY